MDRSLINIGAGCAAALLLMGSTAMSANAYYLGYGNGDPGNWDFWTEQAGGPSHMQPAHVSHVRHAYAHHHHRNGEHKNS